MLNNGVSRMLLQYCKSYVVPCGKSYVFTILEMVCCTTREVVCFYDIGNCMFYNLGSGMLFEFGEFLKVIVCWFFEVRLLLCVPMSGKQYSFQ